MNRFPRRRLRSSSINVALWLAVVGAGCGEAKTSTLEPEEVVNGIAGTLHARIATFEDGHAETYYRLVKADGESIPLDFGDKAPTARVGARIAVRGPQIGERLQVDAFDVLPGRADEQAQPLRSPGPGPKTLKIAMINVSSKANATLQTRTKQRSIRPRLTIATIRTAIGTCRSTF